MTDQNTGTQAQGTQGQDQGSAGGDTTPAKVYASRSEADAAKPTDAPKGMRPFEVLHNGTSKGWVLARGYDHGLAVVARIDGYSLSTGKTVAVTKEAVAAKLAEFTDEELAAMGLARKPQKGKK